jgi:hypothetical protein
MFLDDQLYQIAKDPQLSNGEIRVEMLQAVIDRILEEHKKLVADSMSCDEDLFLSVKRCKRHWYNALKRLEKEGIVIFDDKEFKSFEVLIHLHPLFRGFADALLAYIK